MITIENLHFSYGAETVLHDFSLEIADGSITVIVGRNGSGKSSLLALIAGDLQPESGSILLDGRDVSQYSLAELAQVRSVAAQSHSYWMSYSVREILNLGNEAVSADRFNEVVSALSIDGYLNQSITTLSGGQLQRIEIARAALRPTKWVLLDEPFASQDLPSQSAIIEFIEREKSRGRAFIIVAHERDSELAWCDQVVEIKAIA